MEPLKFRACANYIIDVTDILGIAHHFRPKNSSISREIIYFHLQVERGEKN
jgi:hypothetical protein